jgi:hypothetical protein
MKFHPVAAPLNTFRMLVNCAHVGHGAPRWTINDFHCYGVILAANELPQLREYAAQCGLKVVFTSQPYRTSAGVRVQVNVRANPTAR